MKLASLLFLLCFFYFSSSAQISHSALSELYDIQEKLQAQQIHTAYKALQKFENKHQAALEQDNFAYQSYLSTKAHLLTLQENFEAALPLVEETLVLNQKFKDSLQQSVYTHFVARELYEQIGRNDQAIEQSEQLINALKKMGPSQLIDLARAYRKIGVLYQAKMQVNKSLEYLRKALAVYQKSPATTAIDMANLYRAYAITYFRGGEYDQQLTYLNKAMTTAQKEKTSESARFQISLLSNLGGYYLQTGNFQEGLEVYNKYVTETVKQYGEQHTRTAAAYMNLAITYARTNDFEHAEEMFRKSIAIKKQIYGKKSPDVALSYGNLVVLLNLMQRYEDALQASQNSFIANCVGYEKEDCYVDLVPVVRKHKLLDPINVIGNLNNRSKAFHLLYQKHKDLKYLKHAHQTVLAQVAILDKIKNDLSDQDKIKVLSRRFMPFHQGVYYAYLLFNETKEKKYLEEGFQLAERSKDAVLTSALSSKKALNFGGVPDSLVRQENKLKRQIAFLSKKLLDIKKTDSLYHDYQEELFQLKRDKDAFAQYLEESFPKYYRLKYASNIGSIKEIRENVLTDKSMLLSYYISSPRVYIWAISPEASELIFFELDSTYTQDIAAFRKELTSIQHATAAPKEASQDYARLAYKFYNKFVAPALKGSDAEHLIIIPDQLLGYLPFEAFVTQKVKQATGDYKKMPYLINDYEVQYSYSASLLLQNKLQKQQHSTNKLLAVAATYNQNNIVKEGRSPKAIQLRKKLTDLPEAANEVKALETMFEGDFLYGNAANEKSFKNNISDYAVIHLAMHGLLDAKNPIASSLAFTEDGNPEEDNFLHAAEINNLPLNAQLVVLSACETGYGKFERGEGIMSLARSFMHAGAPSLVVSLWQVNDYSTSIIMELFYEGLKNGLTKSEALRQAKLNYIQNAQGIASHPALWAAFVQLGDREALVLPNNNSVTIYIALFLAVLLLGGGFFFFRKKQGSQS